MPLSSNQRGTIDWTCLFADDKLASQGLKQLLEAQPIHLSFEPAGAERAKLWSLYWSYRMGIRQQGRRTLYFHYPAFYSVATGNLPLLRWPCRLVPPTGTDTNWELQVDSDRPAEINTHWVEWATTAFPYAWATLLEKAAQPAARATALRELAVAMSRETNWTLSNLAPGLVKEASLASFAADLEQGGLIWLASLALSDQMWGGITTSQWREWSLPEAKVFNYPFLLPLVPAEVEAWHLLEQQGRVSIAQRASVYATTQSLSSMLLPHLVAGEPVLVVSRDQCTLDQVTALLNEAGWQGLLGRWQDEQLDWPILQANVQAHLKRSSRSSSRSEESWQVAFGRYRREEQQLQDFLRSSRRAVFGKARWQDVLGTYLRASRREGKALLATHLQASWYAFTPAEYADIQDAIQQTQPLYEALDNLHHPLSDLNAAIFIHQDETEATDFVERTCARLLDLAQPLHQRYIRRQSEYADQLMAQLESTYLELRRRWSKLHALLSDLASHYGNEFLTVRQGTLRLKATFSKRWQAATRERQALISAYQDLRQFHQEATPFAVDWLPDNWTERPVELPVFLEDYERKLTDWQLALPAMMQDEIVRLNYKTADSQLPASAHIQPLEMALEECIDEVNALGLYQLPLQSKHLTLLRQQRYLEEIIERLERTRAGIVPFSSFYAWQRNWFSLSEIARKSIQAILRTRPADWSAAFSSWYYNECLAQTHTPALSFRLLAGKDGVYGRQQLWKQTQRQVRADWQVRRTAAAKTLQLAARQEHLDLATLNPGLGNALSRFAPITLATPELAVHLQSFFPHLLVFEGQRLNGEELGRLIRPDDQRVTVLYDGDTALDKADWRQAWQAANWAEIDSHAAERNTPQQVALPPASLHAIPGLFQRSTSINEEEALAILDWLNTLPAGRGQRVAKVGIVCFTEGQRNHLLQLLYQVKKTHQAAAQHLQRLTRNGLQVIHITDLADYDFTHLLVSVTYGPEDASGKIAPELARWSDEKQDAPLLNLLKCWGRAAEVHWFCSWPTIDWQRDDLQQEASLLVQFLRQADADEPAPTLVDFLPSMEGAFTDQRGEFDPLSRELIFRVGDHFPHWQWAYHRSLGPAHPLLEAQNLAGQRMLFLWDGFLSQSPYSTFQWEWSQRERLQQAGFILVHVPLAALWKSPTTAFHQLLRQLRSITLLSEEE